MEKDSLVEMVGGEREGGDLTRRAIPCERGSADSIVAVSCEHLSIHFWCYFALSFVLIASLPTYLYVCPSAKLSILQGLNFSVLPVSDQSNQRMSKAFCAHTCMHA
jgi:hypothetical protein